MKRMSAIFPSPLTAAVALVLGTVVPAAAQQNSQDYSMVPSYSARPPGMCWHRHVGYSINGLNGYWAACTDASQSQSANSARAQAPTPQHSRTQHR